MWGSKVWYTSVPLVYYSPLGELTVLPRLLSQLEGDTFLHTPTPLSASSLGSAPCTISGYATAVAKLSVILTFVGDSKVA